MIFLKNTFKVFIFSLCFCLSISQTLAETAFVKDLSGQWDFRIDRKDAGENEQWYKKTFTDKIKLPGSLQEQGYGNEVNEHTPWIGYLKKLDWLPNSGKQADGSYKVAGWLQPKKHFIGAAWYQRKLTVPESWSDRQILLHLERVHITTTVWLGDKKLGTQNSLSTAHEYLLPKLAAGTYTLTVRVDNRPPALLGINAHSISDHTQTTWNGIIGKIECRALPQQTWIDAVSIFPDVQSKSIRVKTYLSSSTDKLAGGKITYEIQSPKGADKVPAKTVSVTSKNSGIRIKMGNKISLWDEFTPELYKLKATFTAKNGQKQTYESTFGMVEYKSVPQKLLVNGRETYFRGTLDCATFPISGYPSMDEAYWEKVFKVCQDFGLNHVRYHSWFPPEVALKVADRMGVYLQCEHAWSNKLGDKQLSDYLYKELELAIKKYGNHPSFSIHSYGNEPDGPGQDEVLSTWVAKGKKLDEGRRFYVSAIGWGITENSDFHDIMDGMRVFPWGIGLNASINKEQPSFNSDFNYKTKTDPKRAFVAHETGQWCVYPDFSEMAKYTGFSQPKNYEIFQQNLKDNHMGHLAHDFFMASGRLQTICYKYELEKLLRTKGASGYQLLGLNDFPGQGTALVGAVNVFWEAKPYTSAAEYARFNGATVPLARFSKFVFTEGEKLPVDIDITHFGANALANPSVKWSIKSEDNKVVKSGKIASQQIPVGLSSLVKGLEFDTTGLKAPAKYKFAVTVNEKIENDWEFWVYPKEQKQELAGVKVTRDRDEALELLQKGEKVLFVPLPMDIRDSSPRKTTFGFSSIFWNTAWTDMQPPTTLGILCKPEHPIFSSFPTDYHTNYQWWNLINKAPVPLYLDTVPESVRPIVRVIDDWYTNKRLGLVLEAKVGKGQLLISAIDISSETDDIVVKQFRKSVLSYMNSDKFNPSATLETSQFIPLFGSSKSTSKLVKAVTSTSHYPGCPGTNLLDGNPNTLWSSDYLPNDPMDHSVVFEFKKPVSFKSMQFLPRQGNSRGSVKKTEIYYSQDGVNWGKVVQIAARKHNNMEWYRTQLPQKGAYKFLKLRFVEGFGHPEAGASMAEVIFEQ